MAHVIHKIHGYVSFLLLATALAIAVTPTDANSTPSNNYVREIHVQKAPKAAESPYTYIDEVTAPVTAPNGSSECGSVDLVNSHVFGLSSETFNTVFYPLTTCAGSLAKIKLSVSGRSIGIQYNAFLDVFFEGLQVLRTSTPTSVYNRTAWTYDADITKYASFLSKKRNASISLPTLSSQSTFIISLTVTYYYGAAEPQPYADVIIPITQNSSGYAAFSITNLTNSARKTISNFPKNAYRAQLEIVTTPTGPDQLLAFSAPSEYASQLPFLRTDGVFREIVTLIDGVPVGSVWPKPILYPSFLFSEYWSRLVGIGVYNLPTYLLDITPFIGTLVQNSSHDFELVIPNVSAGSNWLTSAILHVWIDKGSKQTYGGLISRNVKSATVPASTLSLAADLSSVDITVKADLYSSAVGFIVTSFGNFTSTVHRHQTFKSVFRTRGVALSLWSSQKVKDWSSSVMRHSGTGGKLWYAKTDVRIYPLKILTEGFGPLNGYYSQSFDSHSWELFNGSKQLVDDVVNTQNGFGYEDTVSTGGATVTQKFVRRSNYNGCYARSFDATVYGVLVDRAVSTC